MKRLNCLAARIGTALLTIYIAGQAQQTLVAQSASPGGPVLEDRHPRYVLQREDVLFLSFPLTPELNQTVTIQPDGYINLQNSGSVYAQGLTVPILIDAIKRAYAGVLRDPIIDVDLQDFQKSFFTVSGQVGKPGKYELRADTTAAEAIAIAGGLLPTAKMQVFLLRKASAQWFKVEKLDMKDVYNGKKTSEDALIRPGDMVFVPETGITKFRKFVPYGVNAGSYVADNQ
jgi:polysaccharide export outer membrane protein